MEKRSRRRTRDLVTQAASQGLSQNEIGCARISIMARSTNAPCKGRIQMRKTNPLHFFTFGLQRTAGPYKWVNRVTLAAADHFRSTPMSRHRCPPTACLKGACHVRTSHVLSARSETPRHCSKTPRPSPFLECRLDAPPADPRKGPIGGTLGTVGDVPAPGIGSDRID
jgi:hypothetical protein